jgi:hypothetical protein
MAHAKDAVDTPAMSKREGSKSLLALDVIMRLALNVSFLVGCPTSDPPIAEVPTRRIDSMVKYLM